MRALGAVSHICDRCDVINRESLFVCLRVTGKIPPSIFSYLPLCGPHGIVWARDGINFTSNLYTAAECLITILEVECSTTQSFIIFHENLCPVYLNIHGWNVFHFTRNHFVCFNESINHSNITLTRIHYEFVWITSFYTGCTLWSLLYQ